MYNAQNLTANIKAQAKAKNVLVKDMLLSCGLSINALNQITDKKGLSSFSLAKIADCLDCSTDYLLGRAETPSSYSNNNI
ncbi:MAG: helix-turn-helix domain-containing protein, partial [Lachnospiraceae bacterium]